jgi:hypothetical protein
MPEEELKKIRSTGPKNSELSNYGNGSSQFPPIFEVTLINEKVITISAGDGHSFALTENGIKNFFFY